MPWWLRNNLRMIQNNIRDIDVGMDVDKHIEMLKDFGANTLQIGCGGITAHHPSTLECQWVNPYMKGDFLGEVVEKCHAAGIRVIARFDFSKTHESLIEKHPDWYSRRADGGLIRYHDTAATCVNGEYQRKLSLDIIEEVIRKYPVDGIFFNMFGYVTNDYSGNYVGICQCENCKTRFRETHGLPLPAKEDADDPAFRRYVEFKKATVAQQLLAIQALVRSVSPEIAVSTYAFPGVDIVREESNSALDRPLPFWIYSSTDNAGLVEGSYDDKISSNCAINAVDLPYRFMGVSKYLNEIRLWGNLAAGSGLDWCIIGGFEGYPDEENWDSVRRIFHFHKRHESVYGRLSPRSRIMLVRAGDRRGKINKEYRGVFRMLKEEHLQFTIVDADALEGRIPQFDAQDFLFLPAVPSVTEKTAAALRTTKACVVATGAAAFSRSEETVKTLFNTTLGEEVRDVRGAYLRTAPEEVFPDFASVKKRWVFLDQPYRKMSLGAGAEGFLPRVEKARFGPPERCYGHTETESEWMAAAANGNLLLPWNIGELYYQYGYDEFKRLLLDCLRRTRPLPRAFETDAPEMVEMFLSDCGEGESLLQLINMTGFNGMTFFAPPPIPEIAVRLPGARPASVEELTDTGRRTVSAVDPLRISFARGELYKAFLIRS